jgi:hypothetical protein
MWTRGLKHESMPGHLSELACRLYLASGMRRGDCRPCSHGKFGERTGRSVTPTGGREGSRGVGSLGRRGADRTRARRDSIQSAPLEQLYVVRAFPT